MPGVIADYVVHHDFNIVSGIQDKILENYRFDISKHAKGTEKIKARSMGKVSNGSKIPIWSTRATTLGRHTFL
jgi:hypothetical protein